MGCTDKKDPRTENFPKTRERVQDIPPHDRVWVFMMAGQSNMAGRGLVEPEDTIPDQRILSIDSTGALVYAKEPLHFYEPTLTGLDCGVSFARTLLSSVPDSISILMIPTAVGGSSIKQWLGDSIHNGVKLLSNFREKAAIGGRYGEFKAILWHQGETDANERDIPQHTSRLSSLFSQLREIVGNPGLPVLIGELGAYSRDEEHWAQINQAIHAYAATDSNASVIPTGDLKEKGDRIHFDAAGQRTIGQRMAAEYIRRFK